MCRKLCKAILAAVLALSVFSTGALAAAPLYPGRLGHCHVVYGTSACGDANGDGICDLHGAHCRRYCHSVRRYHLCHRPWNTAHCTWHFTTDGSWVRCVDADCNGFCDTCGAAFSVTTGTAATGGNSGTAGTGGNSYGTSGSTGTGGNSYGSSGTAGTGGNSYGNYGSGYYGGGYCGSGGGHHSGHHGGHC